MGFRLVVLVLLLYAFDTFAQPTSLKLRIFDNTGLNEVSGCNIKVTGNKSQVIYSYFNTGNSNSFDKEVTAKLTDDSVRVSISHLSFRDTTLAFSSKVKVHQATVRLNFRTHLLKELVVKGPPIWKRGDTTNFRADAFKQGDEKKLKDLIRNLPGFTIKENGDLLYMNNVINKIKVDGQELFADKVKLLLNSFPVHVIELVQVAENQQANTLLKGFAGGDTYLNLTMKKDVMKLGFGDFEGGLGTKDRYLANSVLFSLSKKIKVGYIGNINSVGDGLDWKLKSELKTQPEREAEALALQNNPLSLISNLSNRYYVMNRLFDNRLDFVLPLGKNVEGKTEFAYVSDRQTQNTTNENTFYNGQEYVNRREDNRSVNKPRLLNLKQILKFAMGSKHALQIKAGWLWDGTRGLQHTVFSQNQAGGVIENVTQNKFNSVSVNAALTHRGKAKTASETILDVNTQQISQLVSSVSPQWNEIFGLGTRASTQFDQHLDNQFSQLQLNHTRYHTVKKSVVKWNSSYTLQQLKLNSETMLTDSSGLQPVKPWVGNTTGTYHRQTINTEISGGNSSKAKNSINYRLNLGLSRTSLLEKDSHRSFHTPEIQARFYYHFTILEKVVKLFFGDVSIDFQNSAIPLRTSNGTYQPRSITSYTRTVGVEKAAKAISLNSSLSRTWFEQQISSSIYFSYNQDFNRAIPVYQYRSFFSFATDSLAYKAVNGYHLGTRHTFPSLLLGSIIEINASLNQSSNLLPSGQETYLTSNQSSTLECILKKNWKKRYYLTFSANYLHNRSKIPSLIADGPRVITASADFISGVKQRFSIRKNVNLLLDTRLVYNSIGTAYQSNFLLLDTEFNVKPKKLPLYFSIKGENLMNQKFYTVFYQYDANQSLNRIPLLGRTVYASVRYEL